MKPETAVKVYLIVGSVLVVVCAVFAGCFGVIFNSILLNILVISEDGSIYETYKAPDVPIYMDFYMFNVTNPDEVQNYGAIPNLQEIGPYKYLETFVKHDLEFSNGDDDLSYYQDKTYYFQEDLSNGLKETDKITTINAVMVIIADRLANLNPAIKALGELLFLRFQLAERVFMTKTVSELLYNGYYDPFIDLLGKLTGDPKHIEGKFGFRHQTNSTNDGQYKVKTGNGGMDDYLEIIEWKGEEELNYWGDDPYCNMLNGTDGTQFPPNVEKSDTLRMFVSDLCRSVFALYEREIKKHGFLDAYRFSLPKKSLEVENCYKKDNFTYKDVMVDIRACQQGAPIVLSTPHFYMGDQMDIDNFNGVEPVKELHETFLDVEPITGLVVEAAKRIQLNVPLKKYANLPAFRNVRESIFPVFWADENFILPEDDADTLHKALTLPFIIVYSICGILIVVGIGLIILGLVKRSRIKREPAFGKLEKK